MTPSTSSELLCALASEPQSARWGEFLSIYRPMLRDTSRSLRATYPSITETDSEDLVAETLLQFAKAIPTFRYDRAKGSFRGFLATVLRRRAVDFVRRCAGRPEDLVEAVPEDAAKSAGTVPESSRADDAAIAPALYRVAHRRLRDHGRFSARALEVFRLMFQEGWTTEQIRKETGLSPAAIRQLKSRLLAAVRREVEEIRANPASPEDILDAILLEDRSAPTEPPPNPFPAPSAEVLAFASRLAASGALPDAAEGDLGATVVLVTENPAARRIPAGGTMFFGRALPNDMPGWALPGDVSASRIHARLTCAANGVIRLEDLGSKNGTFLDDVRIAAPSPLRPGSCFRVGTSSFLVL